MMDSHINKERLSLFLTLSLILTCVEVRLLFSNFSWTAIFSIHVLIIILCIVGLRFFDFDAQNRRFYLLMTLLVAFLGPFGGFICCLTFIFYFFYQLRQPQSTLFEDFFPELEKIPHTVLYERLMYGMEDLPSTTTSISFQDLMLFGTEKQKRVVIEKILKYFKPEFFPALHYALNDASNSVRVHAAAAITTLDDRYYNRFVRLQSEVLEYPNHPDKILQFARHCHQYAESQILDTDREKKMQFYAIEAYQKFLNLQVSGPDVLDAKQQLASLYLATHQLDQAYHLLSNCLQQHPSVPLSFYQLWMEVLFKLNRYTELRHVATQVKSTTHPHNDQEIMAQQMINFWQQGINEEQFRMNVKEYL